MQLLIGRALTDSQEFDKAIPFLNNVHSAKRGAKWQKAWAQAYLGICMFVRGEYEASKTFLSKCVADDVTPNCTKFAVKRMTLFGFNARYHGFDTKSSEHFVFHIESDAKNSIHLNDYISRREQAYDAISEFFGSKLEYKVNYFAWLSKSSLKAEIGAISGFAAPEYGIVHATIDQTAGHEIVHLFVQSKQKTALINEGLAVYLNQEHGDLLSEAKEIMKKSSFTEVDIKQMWETKTNYEVKGFYPIAGAFVEELIKKGGKDRFLKLVEDQRFGNAEKIYGSHLLEIISDFENSLGISD